MVPPWDEFQGSSPNSGVYFHLQVLALRVHLSLTDFIRQVLAFYNVAPTQLMPSAWQTILGYEALCDDFAAPSYSLEDFATFYTIQKLPSQVCFFSPWGVWPKLLLTSR